MHSQRLLNLAVNDQGGNGEGCRPWTTPQSGRLFWYCFRTTDRFIYIEKITTSITNWAEKPAPCVSSCVHLYRSESPHRFEPLKYHNLKWKFNTLSKFCLENYGTTIILGSIQSIWDVLRVKSLLLVTSKGLFNNTSDGTVKVPQFCRLLTKIWSILVLRVQIALSAAERVSIFLPSLLHSCCRIIPSLN